MDKRLIDACYRLLTEGTCKTAKHGVTMSGQGPEDWEIIRGAKSKGELRSAHVMALARLNEKEALERGASKRAARKIRKRVEALRWNRKLMES
jgi:hypothetical protein